MSRAKPRILCVINSLEGGGAERVFVAVTGALAQRFGFGNVELALLDRAEHKYQAPDVSTVVLDAGGRLAPSIRGLAKHALRRRPDAIVSFLSRANVASIVAGSAARTPTVISERVHTSSHFPKGPRGWAGRLSVRAAYPFARRVIAVSDGVRRDLVGRYGVAPSRTSVIFNPIDLGAVRRAGESPPERALPERFLVAVGRLAPNKNMALLLRAFAKARLRSDLVVLGEGPERGQLEALTNDLGIAARVHFLGFVSNPHAVMARAQGYVSASNAEGFPNALLEALALGLPALHTDCPSGPAEILDARGGVHEATRAAYGILAPPGCGHSLAKALELLEDGSVAQFYRARAPGRAAAFDLDRTLARYVGEVESVIYAGTR